MIDFSLVKPQKNKSPEPVKKFGAFVVVLRCATPQPELFLLSGNLQED